jgi:dephospho-CoA kinase
MPLTVGMTGGIGSGKSVAADHFRGLGAEVIDTDQIAHELTRPGSPALAEIRADLGDEVFTDDGRLERGRLRAKVFSDPQARIRLEAILHPLIRAEVLRRIAASGAPYRIVVVPLLFETGAYRDVVDRVLVVDCPEGRQIERTMRRSGLSAEDVRAIMATQAPRAQRLKEADDVLYNDGHLDSLRREVEKLHQVYLSLAHCAVQHLSPGPS